jgi:hypothetical protein
MEQGWFRRFSPNEHEYVLDAQPELTVASLNDVIQRDGGRIETMSVEKRKEGGRRLVLLVRLPFASDPTQLAEMLSALDGISSVDWKS